MKNRLFDMVNISKPKSNLFDLSHEKKMSLNMGDLVPFFLQETVPGDRFRCSSELFLRMAPMLFPVMHRVNVYTHFFFVPKRIIYTEWPDFITGGKDGKQVPLYPKIDYNDGYTGFTEPGTLADYLGLPTNIKPGITTEYISALPFRAYQMIYNEYFRDENLIDEIEFDKSGTNPTVAEAKVLMTMRKRAWEKDYFTSALPWPQKGDDVLLPNVINYKDPSRVMSLGVPTTDGALSASGGNLVNSGQNPASLENIDSLEISINDLRRSNKLQEWLEKNARGGSRLIEVIASHFGVKSSDGRLQRPEYLGGGKQPITISEVLATFNNETVPGATMYGHGISVGKSNSFKRSFEEHGYIIGIMSVLPRTAYQDGIHRMWQRFGKFDEYWPEFAQIGEQEVFNSELYYDTAGGLNKEVFGYQSRYADMKYNQSTVHGDFKENMDFAHMGRKFDTRPLLNETFVSSDPTHRIFAVEDPAVHKLYVQLYNDVKAIRPMPVFGTPKL